MPARSLLVNAGRVEPNVPPAARMIEVPPLEPSEIGALLDPIVPPDRSWRSELDALILAETDGITRDVIAVSRSLSAGDDGALTPTEAFDAVRRAVPYKGLQVFADDDAVRFHGRERAVEEVMSGLGRQSFVAVVGSSGSGKSSVVRAGCMPRLREQGLALIVMSPGEDPLRTLAIAWARAAGSAAETLHQQLMADPTALARLEPSGHGTVLIIDQLEECFTLCSDEQNREQFLRAITHPTPGLRVLATLRGDFFGRASESAELAEVLRSGTVLMAPPTRAELRAVIEEPARNARLRLEPGLSDLILTDITDRPAGLPLLSHALRETWRRRHGNTLTISDYHEAGGATGAIARTADTVYARLTEPQRDIAKRIFLRLTALGEGAEDSRRRVSLNVLLAGGSQENQRVLHTLTAARLITADTDAEGHDVDELAHEALLREWPRLRGWLDEDREELRSLAHLETAARDWDTAGRPESEVYSGRRLEAVEGVSPEKLNDRELAFLAASIEVRESRRRASRRARNRLRAFAAVLVVLLLIATVAGLVAFNQRSSARKDARRAQQQTQIATARELTSQAQAQLSTQPAVALLLAAEAEKTQDSLQSRAELFTTVYNNAHVARSATGFGDDDADFQSSNGILLPRFSLSPDATLASVIGTDGESLQIYDFHTIKPRTPNLDTAGVSIDYVAWSQTDLMAVAFSDGSLRVWDGRTGHQITSTTIPDPTALRGGAGMVFSPTGQVLVLRRIGDGVILRWSIPDGQPIGKPLSLGGFADLTFSPDGSRLAIADTPGIDVIDPISARRLQPTLKIGVGFQLNYGPGGKTLLVSSASGPPTLINAGTGKSIRQFAFPPGYTGPDIFSDGPRGSAYSPDGKYIATIDANGTLVVWRTSDGSVVGGSAFTSVVRGDAISGLYFTPDSKQLVFGDAHDSSYLEYLRHGTAPRW